MKIVLEIATNEAKFAIDVLKSLKFVKNVKPMSQTASELWEELNDAAADVRMHQEGKLKLKTARQVLNEL